MGRPPVSNVVFHALLAHLAEGRWDSGEALPKSCELAAEFGVSLPTLRMSLCEARRNNLTQRRTSRPDVVSPGARKRARQLLDKSPDKEGTIGLLIPEYYFPLINHKLYYSIAQAIIKECRRHHFRAVVIPWSLGHQLEVMSLLRAKDCIAAITIGVRMTYSSALSLLARRKFPIVLFHRRFAGIELPTVRHDDFQAAKFLAAHLVKLGHRNMCFVTGRSDSAVNPYGFPVSADGWWEYLEENNLLGNCVMPVHVVPPKRFEPFGQLFEKLISSQQHPTALVFEERQWARMFADNPRFSNVRIPEDISLVTFSSEIETKPEKGRSPISFAEIDLVRVAECLFTTVTRMLNGITKPPNIRVPLKFHLTGSMAPANGYGQTHII